MPKGEKVTRGKGKASKADSGKKKKGKFLCSATLAPILTETDPNAPKRGLSAYMFFANDQRDKVREENPGIKFGKSLSVQSLMQKLTTPGEVGKMLGEKWKTLSEKQRQPYEAKAAADKKRYEEEKEAYAVSLPST